MVATYEIEQILLERRPTATIRTTTTLANIGAALQEIYGAIEEYLKELGVQPAGAPFARFYSVGPQEIDVEAGFPLASEVHSRWRIRCSELPGGPAIATFHVGPYETMSAAYEALDEWAREHERETAGAPWEVYFSDPASVPDPAQWRTRVVQPLK